jgi:tetratricopeptide (TPR) repeat protein
MRYCLGGMLAAVMVAGCLSLIGCGEEPMTVESVSLLREGKGAYETGDDRLSVDRLTAFLTRFERTTDADEAYYYRGLARYRLGEMSGARTDFAAAVERTRRPDLRARATLALGDLAYEEADMVSAEQMYRLAIDDLDRSEPPTDHALYRLGASLQRQGRWGEANVVFDELIGDFWDSPLADRARRRIRASGWTVQAGAFRTRTRADALAANLRGGRFEPFIVPESVDGELYYLVRIGRFRAYEAAGEILGDVQRVAGGAYVTVTR